MSNTAPAASRVKIAAQVARAASILLLVAMFIGTHIPAQMSPGFSVSDKVLHFTAYMTLALSLLVNWELTAGRLEPKHFFAVWLFCTLWGVVDELTQIPVGRSCDGLDWLADVAGIVVALTIYRLLSPLWARSPLSPGTQ